MPQNETPTWESSREVEPTWDSTNSAEPSWDDTIDLGDVDETGIPKGLPPRERKRIELGSELAAEQAAQDQRDKQSRLVAPLQDLAEGALTGLSLSPSRIAAQFERGIPAVPAAIKGEQSFTPLPPVVSGSLNPGENRAIKIPEIPTTKETPVAGQVAAGLGNAVIEFANIFTTPEGILSLGIGGLPKESQKAVIGTMAANMAAHYPQEFGEAIDAAKAGDWNTATKKIITTPVMSSVMGRASVEMPKVPNVPDFPGLPDPDLVSRNLQSPGTLRPQELKRFNLPDIEVPPEMFEAGNVSFDRMQRFGGQQLPPVQILPKMGRIENVPILEETRPIEQRETRGKVSFGAEAPVLLRNAVEQAESVGLTKSAEAAKQVAKGKETDALQKQDAATGVLRPEEPEMGLPQVGEGNPVVQVAPEVREAPQEVATTTSLPEAAEISKRPVADIETDLATARAESDALKSIKPPEPTAPMDEKVNYLNTTAKAKVVAAVKVQALEEGLKMAKEAKPELLPKQVETLSGQNTGKSPIIAVKLKDGSVLFSKKWSAHIDAASSLPESILNKVSDGGFVVDGKWEPGGDLSKGLKAGEKVGDYYGLTPPKPKTLKQLGESLPDAGESGSLTLPWDEAIKGLKKVRAAGGQLWHSRGVREAMTYMRDAGDNAANLFARNMANNVRGPLRRAFKDKVKLAEDALSAFVEAGGDLAVLAANKAKLLAAPDSKWKTKAIAAHDFAVANEAVLRPMADAYRAITDQQVADEIAAGMDTIKRDNYVMHAQDIPDELSLMAPGGGTGGGAAFRKVRTHETFADSIAAGVEPKTLNAVDLLEARLKAGQRQINNRAWVENLKTMNDPATGNPVVEQPQTVTRADGTTYQEAPAGYELQTLGRQQVAVKKGYEGLFSALTDPSAFTKNMGGRAFMKANGAGKSVNLLFDTFHLARLAFWESLIKGLGITSFKAPVPSYGKGITLLDHTIPEINQMVRAGEIPADWAKQAVSNKQKINALVDAGYNIGAISDALHSDVIHSLPGIGTFNKWLFNQFQRGAMTEVGLLELQRLREARPNLSQAEAARQVAKDLNIRFGNLGRQGVFKSKTFQDLARTLFLAPQWNEGLIRSELGAVKQAGEFIKDTAQGEKLYAGVLLRSVGAMALMQFVANQLINLSTRGKPTWENPEEGEGAKLSAWIPDKVGHGPGFFLHPLGLAAETTHLMLEKYAKSGDFSKVLNQYVKSRASAAMRPILTFLTREDFLGKKIRPDNIWGEVVKSAIPAPIGGGAIVQGAKEVATGVPSETYQGQFQKQMLSSVGIKTDQAPSSGQRIAALAKDYNKAHGVEPSAEFYTGDFEPLTQALRIGNTTEAKNALADLLKKKTLIQVRDHYLRAINIPFTRSLRSENDFKKTLNDEQKATYKKAIEDRKEINKRFRELVKKQ